MVHPKALLENEQSNHSLLRQAIRILLTISGRDAHLKVKFYKMYSEILLVLPLQALLAISSHIPFFPIQPLQIAPISRDSHLSLNRPYSGKRHPQSSYFLKGGSLEKSSAKRDSWVPCFSNIPCLFPTQREVTYSSETPLSEIIWMLMGYTWSCSHSTLRVTLCCLSPPERSSQLKQPRSEAGRPAGPWATCALAHQPPAQTEATGWNRTRRCLSLISSLCVCLSEVALLFKRW